MTARSLRTLVDAAKVLVAQHRDTLGVADEGYAMDGEARFDDITVNTCARCSRSWNRHASVRVGHDQPWKSGGDAVTEGDHELGFKPVDCRGFIPRWAALLGLSFSRDRGHMSTRYGWGA